MTKKKEIAGQELPMIGTRLRKRRIQLGLTQQELADRLGVTKGGLSAYELNKITPNEDKLILLAGILGVSPEYLKGQEELSIGQESTCDEPDEIESGNINRITDRQTGIGSQLVKLMTERGISSKELALTLGIKEELLIMYGQDVKYPSYEILIKIAEVLDVSTEELFGIDTGKIMNIGALSDENRRLVKNLVRRMK